MRLDFPYNNVPALEIPDDNLLGYFKPKLLPHGPRLDATLAQSLANPIGSPPLSQLISPGKRVAIVCDDITRKTPTQALLPSIILEVQRAGVFRDAIKIVVATGTHGKMTQGEKERKLGKVICDQYAVIEHDWLAEDQLEEIGETASGMKIFLNRAVVEADVVIGVGHIVPHRCTGFAGGAEVIFPGVADGHSIGHLHWASAQQPGHALLGVAENPIRSLVDEVGRMAGLRFIVNVVQDVEGNIAEIVAGDLVEAHRVGCARASEVFGVQIPEQAEIVIADASPADLDLWQAMKAVFAMDLAVRQGGVIIIVAPCPEGVSPVNAQLGGLGYRPSSEVRRMVADGQLTDLLVAAHLVWGGQVIKDRAACILVSQGITSEDSQRMGFLAAATPQEALAKAFEIMGSGAKVLAFHHGAEVLPISLSCELPAPY